jgi:hypothetical protein
MANETLQFIKGQGKNKTLLDYLKYLCQECCPTRDTVEQNLVRRHQRGQAEVDSDAEDILIERLKDAPKYTPDKKEIDAEVEKWGVFHTELASALVQSICWQL